MSGDCLGIVLLVEDEPLVRLVTAEILVEAHFRVLEAGTAEEALTVLRAGIDVDVLVSDVEMPPGLNGYELAREVRGCWPLVEILIMSGREWPKEGDLLPGVVFLAKPCSNAALVSYVQSAAERAQAAKSARSVSGEAAVADEATMPLPKTG